MIYLDHEQEAFTETKVQFTEALRATMRECFRVYEEKGTVRDGTPLHHRQSPTSQLGIAQAKCRRLNSLLTRNDWQLDPTTLDEIIEEAGDAANYLLFISALCSMLRDQDSVTTGRLDV